MLSDLVAKFGAAALKIVAVILVVTGLFLWGRHYQLQAKIVQEQLQAKIEQVNQANYDIDQLKKQYSAYQEAQSLLTSDTDKQNTKVITITRTINNAPKTVSCAHSPAIAAVLDGLRVPAASASNSIGQPVNSGKPSVVQGGTSSSGVDH